jgi:hypothetical protein
MFYLLIAAGEQIKTDHNNCSRNVNSFCDHMVEFVVVYDIVADVTATAATTAAATAAATTTRSMGQEIQLGSWSLGCGRTIFTG